jgi:dolichol kinase
MVDAVYSAVWVAVLAGGLALAVVLTRLGVSRSHARDVLHVGAGLWPLGWPSWQGLFAPLAIVWGALLAMVAVPSVARHVRWVARVRESVSSEEERWSGLVLYTLSVAVLTTVGLTKLPFAAGGALLALALGGGVGGAVGLAYGRHRFRAPGGKTKSLEGSLAVAFFAALGVLLSARWFSVPLGFVAALLAGLLAAVAEALSPKGTDNVLVPGSVFCFLVFFRAAA